MFHRLDPNVNREGGGSGQDLCLKVSSHFYFSLWRLISFSESFSSDRERFLIRDEIFLETGSYLCTIRQTFKGQRVGGLRWDHKLSRQDKENLEVSDCYYCSNETGKN